MSEREFPPWHPTRAERDVCAEVNGGECPHDAEFMASLPWPDARKAAEVSA